MFGITDNRRWVYLVYTYITLSGHIQISIICWKSLIFGLFWNTLYGGRSREGACSRRPLNFDRQEAYRLYFCLHRRRRWGGGAPFFFWKPKIRAKAMGNSGKSNGNFRQKQWEIRSKAIIFARNICRRFPSFLIAFPQIFPLLFPEFPIAFARISPKFPLLFPEIRAKAIGNSGKSNEKTRKRWDIFRAKIMEVLGNFTNYH